MEQTEHILSTIYILWFYHVSNSWQNCLAFVETVRAHVCLLGSPPPKAVLCWKCIFSKWEKHHHLLESFIWGCYCYVSQRPLGFNVSGWGHLELSIVIEWIDLLWSRCITIFESINDHSWKPAGILFAAKPYNIFGHWEWDPIKKRPAWILTMAFI